MITDLTWNADVLDNTTFAHPQLFSMVNTYNSIPIKGEQKLVTYRVFFAVVIITSSSEVPHPVLPAVTRYSEEVAE